MYLLRTTFFFSLQIIILNQKVLITTNYEKKNYRAKKLAKKVHGKYKIYVNAEKFTQLTLLITVFSIDSKYREISITMNITP